MTQHEQGLVAENAALREENEALKAGRCLHEISEPAVNQQLTNAQIDEVFSCLPEGAMGFLKSWGYRQFARKLMSLYAATVQAAPAAVAVPDEAQIKALMRKHRIWIEHSTLFEDDEPPRELRAVQAEQHQFESFVQDLIALAAAPAAAAPVVLPEPAGEVVAKLLELARIVDRAVDDWGESHADGSSTVIFQKDEADARDAILDYFDSLPENPDPLILDSRPIKAMRALLATATGLPAQAYQDSTPQLHVGESSFEGWYAGYVKEGTVSLKQNCRDAYAAGMGDPLVAAAPQAQAAEQAPVLYVSKGHLAKHRDPDGPDSTEHGRYLPARVTPAGKFTTPLFSAPQAQADARDAVEKLPRYTYGYKSDEWGMSSHLRSYQDPDGKFLNREEVSAAIAVAKGE